MRLKSFISLVFLLLLSMADAAAQITPSGATPDKWEFSFFGGFGSLGGTSQVITPVEGGGTNTVSLNQEGGYVLGLRINENLGRFFGAELEYSIADHTTTLFNVQPGSIPFAIDQRVHNINYNGVVYAKPRGSRVRPFGAVGAGMSLFHVSQDSGQLGVLTGLDLKDRWKFALTVGAGVKIAMGRRWGVRLDFRDHISGLPDYGLPRSAMMDNGVISPAFRPDGLYHHLQFVVGISYWFDP